MIYYVKPGDITTLGFGKYAFWPQPQFQVKTETSRIPFLGGFPDEGAKIFSTGITIKLLDNTLLTLCIEAGGVKGVWVEGNIPTYLPPFLVEDFDFHLWKYYVSHIEDGVLEEPIICYEVPKFMEVKWQGGVWQTRNENGEIKWVNVKKPNFANT